MAIRVLIADDHPVFLDGLSLLLSTAPGILVVGSAATGDEVVALAAGVTFDVAVIDLDMPGLDGAGATRRILAHNPDARVLILTMHEDRHEVHRALSAGAHGYLLKGAARGSIVRAIETLADGQTVLDGAIGAHIVQAATSSPRPVAFAMLTPRELEVLRLVALGLPNPAIASRLFLSVKTVQNRVSDILAKTGASSRAELVARARDARLGTDHHDDPG
ncbi:Oxygen regulatory protein NreC [Tessaracoccus sp. O5.2]|uniref:response regulator n=1 Tax=Tessaracoccus sp. O5.2 TaxID=3157622 RepID=UPI0035E78182